MYPPHTKVLALPAAIVCLACSSAEDDMPPLLDEGMVSVTGGQVWYRVAGGGEGTPLLLLHGGPGMTSHYLEPLAELGDERPVICYDQVGGGRSEHVTDTTLFTIERFVQEVDEVREALALDEVHLLGHSWGTILAVEYMRTNPEGVRSLTLASPALDIELWLSASDSLLRTLPDSLQQVVAEREAAADYDSPEYQAAVTEYYEHFLSRSTPWSPWLDSTLATGGWQVYNYMWGPSEFTATGTLQDYNGTNFLPNITLPVLFTTGGYDAATPAAVEHYASLVPDARVVLLEESAHLTMLDQPARNVEVVRQFLSQFD